MTAGPSRTVVQRVAASTAGVSRRDVAITAVLSVLGVLLMVVNTQSMARGRKPDEAAAVHVGNLVPYNLTVPLFLLVTLPLLWRRVAPPAALGAVLAGVLVNQALIGTEVIRCGVLLPTAYVLVFAAAQLHGRRARLGLALGALVLLAEIPTELGAGGCVLAFPLLFAVWGIGRVVHSRTLSAAELAVRTAELRTARDETARLQVAGDRSRLSHELDVLLQRRLAALVRLTDAAAPGAGEEAAVRAFAEIERESRRTLEEMRAVVGVLRDDETELPTAPQPTLTHLEGLLVRAKGSAARLTVEGDQRVLPVAVELSAYRIVEHLLDALQDTPDVEVHVRFGDRDLQLAISGPARRRGEAAIERARERVRSQHGTLQTSTRGGRAQAVVSLPVLATTA